MDKIYTIIGVAFRINRNIVECKWSSEGTTDTKDNSVLIETLWNVNGRSLHWCEHKASVLIETLWNVNTTSASPFAPLYCCINRNIVECKLLYDFLKYQDKCVLIETLWNVNSNKLLGVTGQCRINRNIVECKLKNLGVPITESAVLIETLWNVNILICLCSDIVKKY